MGATEWSTSSKKIISSSGDNCIVIPFIYNGRWFVKALNLAMTNLAVGTSIAFDIDYIEL